MPRTAQAIYADIATAQANIKSAQLALGTAAAAFNDAVTAFGSLPALSDLISPPLRDPYNALTSARAAVNTAQLAYDALQQELTNSDPALLAAATASANTSHALNTLHAMGL